MTNEELIKMSRAELKQMPALSHDQLLILQQHARVVEHRCGSLQTADGLPCLRHPRAGWTVCRKHGERAPQTAAKAERLLAVARIPGIQFLLDEIERANEEGCPGCGYNPSSLKERKHVASLAIRLLDRTGFGPGSKVDVSINKSDQAEVPLENWEVSEKQELRILVEQIRSLKDRVARRLAAHATRAVLEGEVVRREMAQPLSDVKSLAPAVGREETSSDS